MHHECMIVNIILNEKKLKKKLLSKIRNNTEIHVTDSQHSN